MTVHYCPHEWAVNEPATGLGWRCAKCDEFSPGADGPGFNGAPVIVYRSNCGTPFRVVDPSTYPHGHTTFDEEEPIHEHWSRFGNGHTVIDVGACFGSYTLPALARGCRVIAFEPSDDGRRLTLENVEANGWGNRCEVWRATLWDGTPYPADLFNDVFTRSYPAKNDPPWFTTLDEFFAPRCEQSLSAIKIDVEGAELGVLMGGLETIRKHHPVLLVEDHDGIAPGLPVSDYPASINSSSRIHSMLHDLGYETRALTYERGRKYIVAEVK